MVCETAAAAFLEKKDENIPAESQVKISGSGIVSETADPAELGGSGKQEKDSTPEPEVNAPSQSSGTQESHAVPLRWVDLPRVPVQSRSATSTYRYFLGCVEALRLLQQQPASKPAGAGKNVSKLILLGTSTLIFLIAGVGLGVSLYVYYHVAAAKAVTTTGLLRAVYILSVVLMGFSILGYKTALNPPGKNKRHRCMYVSLLLILFFAEFFAARVIFNAGHTFQLAQTHHFAVQSASDKAAKNDALVFLHDQLAELYDGAKCQGGQPWSADGSSVNFSQVECHNKAATQALNSLFGNASISEEKEYATYKNCTMDPAFKSSSQEFTLAFCGSEAHIVSLAVSYGCYLVWAPVCLAVLSFVLLSAMICIFCEPKMHCADTLRWQCRAAQSYYRNTRTMQVQTEPLQPQSPRLQIHCCHPPLGESEVRRVWREWTTRSPAPVSERVASASASATSAEP